MDGKLKIKLGEIIQSTVLKICKNVVPYSSDLVIQNNLSIEADKKEIAKLSFKQVLSAESNSLATDKSSQMQNESVNVTPAQGKRQVSPCERFTQTNKWDVAGIPCEFKTPNAKQDINQTTPSPQTGSLSNMRNLTGSRQSLVDTLVAEALKIWYDEGSSPERLHEMRKEYASDAHKSAAVELGIEAMDQYGQISPETLEAAAQLRRLREQPPLNFTPLSTNAGSQLSPAHLPKENLEPKLRTKHSRKQKLEVNHDFETPKKLKCKNLMDSEMQESHTPMKNSNGMYQCPVCAKEFTFATNLTRHQRNFHGRPYSRKTKEKGDLCKRQITDKKLAKSLKTFEPNDGNSISELNGTEHLSQSDSSGIAMTGNPCSNSESVHLIRNVTDSDGTDSTGFVADSDSGSVSGDVDSGKELPPALRGRYKYISISEEPPNKYSCNMCDRKFPHYRNLGRHLKVAHATSIHEYEVMSKRSHPGENLKQEGPYKCKVCGQGFAFSSNLYRHMSKVHKISKNSQVSSGESMGSSSPKNELTQSAKSGHGPLNCDLCPAKFTVSSNLSRHIRRVHKVQRVPVTQEEGSEKRENSEENPEITASRGEPIIPNRSGSTPPPNPALLLSSLLNSTPPPPHLYHTPQSQYHTASSTISQQFPSPLLRPPSFNSLTLSASNPQAGHEIPSHSLPQLSSPNHPCSASALGPPPVTPVVLPQFSDTNIFQQGLGVGSLSQHIHNLPQSAPYPHHEVSPSSSSVSSDVNISPSTSSESSPPQLPQQMTVNNSYNQANLNGGNLQNPLSNGCLNTPAQNGIPPLQSPNTAPNYAQYPPNPSNPLQSPPINNNRGTNNQGSLAQIPDVTPPVNNVRSNPAHMKRYRCHMCSQKFTLRTNLVRHMKNVHKQSSPQSDGELRPTQNHHLLTSQNNNNKSTPCVPLKIPVLPLSTRTSNLITSHNKKKSLTKSGSSSKGGKHKKSPPTSPRHRHTCTICGNAFTFRTNLTRHMRIQHNQVPGEQTDTPDP